MDDVDIASEHEAKTLAAQIAAARVQRITGLVPCGACHYCDTLVTSQRLFCDGDCADAWSHERARFSQARSE